MNDLKNVEEGIVFNKNTNTAIFLDAQGQFKIQAKVNDTLVVLGLSYRSKRVVLSDKDFTIPLLKINVERFPYQLEEVVIAAKNGMHPIEGNTQSIVDLQFFDDSKSSPKNLIWEFSCSKS